MVSKHFYTIIIFALASIANAQTFPRGCTGTPTQQGFRANFYTYPSSESIGDDSDTFFTSSYRTVGSYEGSVSGIQLIDFNLLAPPGNKGEVYGFTTTPNNFSIELIGYFLAPHTGAYTFVLDHINDGASLQVGRKDGTNCCDTFDSIISSELTIMRNGAGRYHQEKKVYLRQGTYYPIRVMYYNQNGQAQLNLSVNLPNGLSQSGIFPNVWQLDVECPQENVLSVSSITTTSTGTAFFGTSLPQYKHGSSSISRNSNEIINYHATSAVKDTETVKVPRSSGSLSVEKKVSSSLRGSSGNKSVYLKGTGAVVTPKAHSVTIMCSSPTRTESTLSEMDVGKTIEVYTTSLQSLKDIPRSFEIIRGSSRRDAFQRVSSTISISDPHDIQSNSVATAGVSKHSDNGYPSTDSLPSGHRISTSNSATFSKTQETASEVTSYESGTGRVAIASISSLSHNRLISSSENNHSSISATITVSTLQIGNIPTSLTSDQSSNSELLSTRTNKVSKTITASRKKTRLFTVSTKPESWYLYSINSRASTISDLPRTTIKPQMATGKIDSSRSVNSDFSSSNTRSYTRSFLMSESPAEWNKFGNDLKSSNAMQSNGYRNSSTQLKQNSFSGNAETRTIFEPTVSKTGAVIFSEGTFRDYTTKSRIPTDTSSGKSRTPTSEPLAGKSRIISASPTKKTFSWKGESYKNNLQQKSSFLDPETTHKSSQKMIMIRYSTKTTALTSSNIIETYSGLYETNATGNRDRNSRFSSEYGDNKEYTEVKDHASRPVIVTTTKVTLAAPETDVTSAFSLAGDRATSRTLLNSDRLESNIATTFTVKFSKSSFKSVLSDKDSYLQQGTETATRMELMASQTVVTSFSALAPSSMTYTSPQNDSKHVYYGISSVTTPTGAVRSHTSDIHPKITRKTVSRVISPESENLNSRYEGTNNSKSIDLKSSTLISNWRDLKGKSSRITYNNLYSLSGAQGPTPTGSGDDYNSENSHFPSALPDHGRSDKGNTYITSTASTFVPHESQLRSFSSNDMESSTSKFAPYSSRGMILETNGNTIHSMSQNGTASSFSYTRKIKTATASGYPMSVSSVNSAQKNVQINILSIVLAVVCLRL